MNDIDLKNQRLCVYSGILWGLLFFLALAMSGNFPPPKPSWGGPEVWQNISDFGLLAKASIILGILGAGFAMPFNALITGHIYRIEQHIGGMPLLSIISLMTGICNIVAFLLVFYAWAAMFYRADPDAEVVQFANDYVWLIIVMAFSAPALQMVVIAMAGFRDQRDTPLFPRWYNFLMLWIALGTCTGTLAIFFYGGPFSWNGIIGFWIPAAAFCVWLVTLCYFFFKSVAAQTDNPRG